MSFIVKNIDAGGLAKTGSTLGNHGSVAVAMFLAKELAGNSLLGDAPSAVAYVSPVNAAENQSGMNTRPSMAPR